MPLLRIRHLTAYRYRKPVGFGEHRLMLRPREGHDQRVLSADLRVTPEALAAEPRHIHDVFGNCVGLVRLHGRADTLAFESCVTLEHAPAPPVSEAEEALAPSTPVSPFAYGAEDMPDLLRLIAPAHADPSGDLAAFARRFLRPQGSTPVMSLLADMTHGVHEGFRYAKRFDGLCQSPAETLTLRTGTCRDFAVLFMEAARSLGLAARFVSGYVYSPSHGSAGRQGGGHTHAWAQVYLPSWGWVEFDPTNGIVGNADLVKVAVAREPAQAVPLSGSYEGEADDFLSMTVEVDVAEDAPSVRRAA